MKTTLSGVALGVLAFLVATELLCRVLPVSSATKAGYHVDPAIMTYGPGLEWRYATGWDLRNPQRLRNNRQGFVSERDFVRDPRAIAFIGDSYVESASLDAADRPAAQLERALGGSRPVYAMGNAGTSLLDYAERIRWASEQFDIRDFVLLVERGDAVQSLCGSGNIASQCLDPATLAPRVVTSPPPSAATRVLRESALAQYLVSQLKLSPARLLQKLSTREVPGETGAPRPRHPAATEALPQIDAVTAEFFRRALPHVRGRLIIVVDANRKLLAGGQPDEDKRRTRFMEIARKASATVVDTEPLFATHFKTSTLSLDIGPYDGHYNRLGVALIAHSIATELAP